MTAAPARRPCPSCPYRRDVPSGVWAAEEYAKLPAYDRPTAQQPPRLFLCHQRDGRVCAGWAGCHDMDHSLAVRVAAMRGDLDVDTVGAVLDYDTDVPLHESGAAAAAHGLADLTHPGPAARTVMGKLTRGAAARKKEPHD